ncbi:MAG: hypothetical protein KC422_24780 [Trueperaceae bacterium]|nr:hypothetical protein [Trueperaceae bacterium]
MSDDTTAHGFFSFDLSACLPEGRLLSEAVFNVYQAGTSGNPDSLGSMILEHVSYGNSLSRSVYDTPALATMGNFDLLPFTSTGRVFLDVTSAVQDDLANRATRGNRSQFRLRFTNFSNFDGNYDYVAFEAANPARSRDFVPFIQANYLIP